MSRLGRLAFCAAVVAAAPDVSTQVVVPSPSGFHIRIPPGIAPETVLIDVAEVSAAGGASMYTLSTEAGKRTYPLRGANLRSVKLLFYAPGYQMVAREFRDAELTSTFVPTLTRLATIRLDGLLVDSANQPIPHQPLELDYSLMEAMRYFNYMDGVVPEIRMGRASTDDIGAFSFDLPAFSDDPFFQRNPRGWAPGRFQLKAVERSTSRDATLQPSEFGVSQAYPTPFIVVRTDRGVLSGRLGPDFFARNGLTGDLTQHLRNVESQDSSLNLQAGSADGHFWQNAMLKSDGTFEVHLPPGTYDLRLLVLGPGSVRDRTIDVARGLVVQEGQRLVVRQP